MTADALENVTPDVGQTRLTYAQLAHRLGISGEAVRILVRRRGWQRIIPNKKGSQTVVVIPTEELEAELEARNQRPDAWATTADSGSSGLVALVDRTLAKLDEAEKRADEANRRADVAVALADKALAQAAEAERRADNERTRGDRAEQRVEELRQQIEQRKGQGRLRRAWQAWRGE